MRVWRSASATRTSERALISFYDCGWSHSGLAWRCTSAGSAAWILILQPTSVLTSERLKPLAGSTWQDFCTDVADYYSAADIFVLTSREDPFPTVVLEAMMAGTAVVAFDGAGGIPEMLRRFAIGAVVDFPNVDEMARQVITLSDRGRSAAERQRVASIAQQNFSFRSYAKDLLFLRGAIAAQYLCCSSKLQLREAPSQTTGIDLQSDPSRDGNHSAGRLLKRPKYSDSPLRWRKNSGGIYNSRSTR